MLTLFSIPKPFTGHIGLIQRNAVASWMRLEPRCRVILFGDEAGVAEAAAELGVEHDPVIRRNEFGTPLLDDLFAAVQRRAQTPLLAYVNTDILLTSDFLPAVVRVGREAPRFLMIGQRVDLDITEPLALGPAWEADLRRDAAARGRLHLPVGIDYFVLPKDAVGPLPPFAVGRPGWDNWFLYDAQRRGLVLVDATPCVLAVHQNHTYDHLGGGARERNAGPEAARNRELAGGVCFIYSIHNATQILTPRGLRRAVTARHLRQRWRTFVRAHPRLEKTYRALRVALRLGRKIEGEEPCA
jgi:hypothetical protein